MCLQAIIFDTEASSFSIQMPLPSSYTSSESKAKICMLNNAAIASLPNGCLPQSSVAMCIERYCKNFLSCWGFLWSDHRIRLRFSAHFFGLWTAHWWWRSSHAAGGDPVGFEIRSHMSTLQRFCLSGSWEGCGWFGGLGTAKATWAYCSRSTLSSLSSCLQDLEVKKNSMDQANEAVAFG